MDAPCNWKVPIKLIDVKVSLASYHGYTLEIHTQSFPRDLDNYCIISYVWSHENKFSVDEIWSHENRKDPVAQEQEGTFGLTRTRRTIESCSMASFVAMLDICGQMGMEHVWIDCVCVEQENPKVKSLQLAEMGYYYSRATKCLVFLNGLDMYIPPIFEGGNIGSWYDRVWTVQEAAYTFGKKVFVHAFPPARIVLESSDTIAFLRVRPEHADMISRCLTRNKYIGSNEEVCKIEDVPPVSEWSLGLVCEENYSNFQKLVVELAHEVSFCSCHYARGTDLHGKSARSLDVNPNNVTQIIREAMRGSRGCRYPQDRVYSILTLLGIKLDVSYGLSLRDTICKAAKAMSPQMLAQFVTATWYSQYGHVLPEVTADSQVVMSISNCFTNIKVEGDDLLITTMTKSVTISFLAFKAYNFRQSKVFGSNFEVFGRPCLLDGEVIARGEVDLTSNGMGPMKLIYHQDLSNESASQRAKLLVMGKGSMKGFVNDGSMNVGRSSGDIPANVWLVVRHVNGVWIKIGVLYVSEDLIFDPKPEQLALKL
jgi:hypothetical protein